MTSIYNLAFDTGARRCELCAAQTIKRNLQYTPQKGVYTTSPKNGKSRIVNIAQETLALLRQLRNKQAESCISQWVFTQDGSPEPMFPQSPTKYFKSFGKRYGIINFHPHLLRHPNVKPKTQFFKEFF